MQSAQPFVAGNQTETASVGANPARPRLDSIDLMRGLIMVLMALDHTRDFFTNVRFDPLDLTQTTPALFLTRWITHFCAPVFIFLAGVGACLARNRGRSKRDLSWFLFSRGVWLAFLEVTWVYSLGWSFNFDLRNVGVGVLWAIGWSMVCLAALIWLPNWAIATFAVSVITLHNSLDWITPGNAGPLSWLVTVLHVPGPVYEAAGWNLRVGYVIVPWVGVLAAGYAFGVVYTWQTAARRKFMLTLGVLLTVAFVIIRGLNGYGDPRPWAPQQSLLHKVFAFIDTCKYPPSLDYLLMTLGPALLLLSLLEKKQPKLLQPAIIFGRVPLFYYLIHLPLLHGMAVIVALIRHGHAEWLFRSPFSNVKPPSDAGFGLIGVYAFWILAILILYPTCRWFSELKKRRRDAWLSYL